MNLLKLISTIGMVIFLSIASANERMLYFHIDCLSASDECMEIPLLSGEEKTVLIKTKPELAIGKRDVLKTNSSDGESAQKYLQLRLGMGAGNKLAKITGDNIGKRLVVVSDGKALTAPVIKQAITSGSVIINAAIDNNVEEANVLPWLNNTPKTGSARGPNWSPIKLGSYALLGILLIGGCIYVAFFRRG
jgi:hypothetical protein